MKLGHKNFISIFLLLYILFFFKNILINNKENVFPEKN